MSYDIWLMNELDLVEDLLRELGEPIDDDTVAGFTANHGRQLIAEAASGDVAALVQLRQQCGLSAIR